VGVTLSLFVTVWMLASEPCVNRVEGAVTSLDGRVQVFIARDPRRLDSTALGDVAHEDLCVVREGSAPKVLLVGRGEGPGVGPEKTLASFAQLVFSTDGATLFFTTTGWVTSPAAHSVELATGKERFLFDGAVVAPISKGQYLASHFRLDDSVPVSSPKYRGRIESWSIVTRDGRVVKKLSEEEAHALSPR
jgi:hypothetical protein